MGKKSNLPSPLNPKSNNELIQEICGKCGLCCSGVLFGDVELHPSDSGEALKKAGFKLRSKGRKICFRQPCSFHGPAGCGAYLIRPLQCQKFECKLLQKSLSEGCISPRTLKLIQQTKSKVNSIEALLTTQEETPQNHLPLNQRCAAIFRQPIDLAASTPQSEKNRGTLMAAVSKLSGLLRNFV
jgi:Fe-S-cluster containining protein